MSLELDVILKATEKKREKKIRATLNNANIFWSLFSCKLRL